MIRKERRWYALLAILVIALMLITLYISKRRIQQLEETKPSLGIRVLPPSSPGMTISSNTLYKTELT